MGIKQQSHLQKLNANQAGKSNRNWKGDAVGYYGIHAWVRKHKPKPAFCVDCNNKPPMDLANISGAYKRDIADYDWLCRSCHKKRDIGEKTKQKFSINAQQRIRDQAGRFLC